MNASFIAIFPGDYLYNLDNEQILIHWNKCNQDKYIINLTNIKSNSSIINFSFIFQEIIKKEAMKNIQKKSEFAYNILKQIKSIFDKVYKCKLYANGVLEIEVVIPEDIVKKDKIIAIDEVKSQLYHVSDTIFRSIRFIENMKIIELNRNYVFIGSDRFDLCLQICNNEKNAIDEDIFTLNKSIHKINDEIGTIDFWFPLSVMRGKKQEAIQTTIDSKLIINNKLDKLARNDLCMYERLSTIDDDFICISKILHESISLVKQTAEGVDRIENLFSFQLNVTGIVLGSFGLLLPIISLFFIEASPILLGVELLFILILCLGLFILLNKFSSGETIIKEIEHLINQLNRK